MFFSLLLRARVLLSKKKPWRSDFCRCLAIWKSGGALVSNGVGCLGLGCLDSRLVSQQHPLLAGCCLGGFLHSFMMSHNDLCTQKPSKNVLDWGCLHRKNETTKSPKRTQELASGSCITREDKQARKKDAKKQGIQTK